MSDQLFFWYCIAFVALCFVIAVGVVLWPDPHEDEEIEAMRRQRK